MSEDTTTTTTETTQETETDSKKTAFWKKLVTVIWQAIVAAITAWTASSCCNVIIN